jgi:hypothetical protein
VRAGLQTGLQKLVCKPAFTPVLKPALKPVLKRQRGRSRRAQGLDVRAWSEQGIVDVVIAEGYDGNRCAPRRQAPSNITRRESLNRSTVSRADAPRQFTPQRRAPPVLSRGTTPSSGVGSTRARTGRSTSRSARAPPRAWSRPCTPTSTPTASTRRRRSLLHVHAGNKSHSIKNNPSQFSENCVYCLP